MHKCGTSRRPTVSVCPYVTFLCCIETAEDIITLFLSQLAPSFEVSWTHAPLHNFKGNPLGQGVKLSKRFAIFGQYRFIFETVRDRLMVTMDR